MGLDFIRILEKMKQGNLYLVPDFVVGKNIKDLMIRGNRFYAVWNEKIGMWDTDETAVQLLTDDMVMNARNEINKLVQVDLMTNFSSNVWNQWQKYCKALPDNYHELDTKIIFSNTDVKKEDYSSKRLPYAIEKAKTPAYDKIMNTLYIPEEREKLEWAIGAIISGDSKKLQKFIVLYGGPGTGKSTVLNIIQQLFEGYYTMFDAKELANANAAFALEQFKSNPLVAIQHDGDLSHIEDNTKLNSIISHEKMMVNEKHKNLYSMKFNSFLFMGTNKPVHISEAKSGLTRRLIDVRPSNRLLSPDEYISLMEKIPFELGGIAQHCLDVYNKMGFHYYDKYVPEQMMMATNDFYDFMEDQYDIFYRNDSTSLESAYALYKVYNDSAGVNYPYPKRRFREELKAYFEDYQERKYMDGNTIRHYYSGFKTERFGFIVDPNKPEKVETWLKFNADKSIFDSIGKDYPAQLTNAEGTPLKKWSDCTTTLKDISSKELHYVKVPTNHIVIDFDIKNENGEKDYNLNLKAASKFPATYAELSKSGAGIHLHYIYNGDVKQLSRVYDNEIEIKVFTGNSSLRRQLSKCNDLMISTINSGLPLKEGKDMAVDKFVIKNEKALRTLIKKNLNKECHASTKPSVDYIYSLLEDAYNSGMSYDVTDLRMPIMAFAMGSSNQSEYCTKLVAKMKFQSEETSQWSNEYEDQRLIFYDIEVFPNLFLVNWKFAGEDASVVRMINPSPQDIEQLCKHKLVGFNNRRYDNHIMYARLMGYSNEQLYKQSQKIINGEPGAMFGEAYNLSYTDVYDFAAKKQSLKKWEIELKIHHQELGLPWDEPVPEEMWEKVAEYCDNDVIATEAVFNACQGDFLAREILAEIAGGCVNDTTNSLTTKLIFGKERKPQSTFAYRDLSKPVYSLPEAEMNFLKAEFPEMMAERHGPAHSLLPYFEGYKFDKGKSSYKGVEEVGEGGRVSAKPGIYYNVWTFDVGSMHPHSVTSEYLFGPYTKIFNDLMNARMFIKHKEFDKAGELFDGKLKPYLTDESKAKSLANALKIAINSVYGLTAAKFENAFKDPRNKDNIVAKRGALFMIDLQEAVEARGGKVIHIKTDSIKVENPTEEIKEFIMEFGKRYGYTFEVEHIFEKICLVNNAVYVGKLADNDPEEPGEWTATGAEFAVPYIFKTLFTHDPIVFEDMCETKAVSSSLYLDMNENLNEDEHDYQFVGKVGLFCPIRPGAGGGELMREKDGKYSYATGSKGWRWLESEMVETLDKGDDIDLNYFRELVDTAVNDIQLAAAENTSTIKDAEWFINGEGEYVPEFMRIPDGAPDELPFDI